MHGNESAENYLETILILSQRLPVVRSVDVATELNFKKSSVSVAMKKLPLPKAEKKLPTAFTNGTLFFHPGWSVSA